MNKSGETTPLEWLTPAHAVAILAPRLVRPDDARAIELILDHAAEGCISSKVRRIAIASRAGTSIEEGHAIPAYLWRAIRDGSTYACWDTGDFDVQFYDVDQGWITATFRGTRVAFKDVDALVPLPYATATDTPVSFEKPLLAWSEDQMRSAIAACPVANRERAWKQHFAPTLHEHGWNNTAWRHLWSDARGSKGRTGRPPQSMS